MTNNYNINNETFNLILNKDGGYLVPDHKVPLENIELPTGITEVEEPVMLTCKIIRYNIEEKGFFVDVIKYGGQPLKFSDFQEGNQEVFKSICRIKFRSLDTIRLLKIIKAKRQPIARGQKVVQKRIFLDLKDIELEFGCASFQIKLPELDNEVSLMVANTTLRPEYNAIKTYFGNVLKLKKVAVDIHLIQRGGEIEVVNVGSVDLERIDESILDQVRFYFLKKKISRGPISNVDQSLFTPEEYLDSISGSQFNANQLYQNESGLLEDLIHISKSKHYQQLQYLAAHHAYQLMKLRLVHKPFSFIFLLEGEERYHLVWETLDTREATYIWHVDKNIKLLKRKVKLVDHIINTIMVQGKTVYITSTEDDYTRIFHNYSNLVRGFVQWKAELESCLT